MPHKQMMASYQILGIEKMDDEEFCVHAKPLEQFGGFESRQCYRSDQIRKASIKVERNRTYETISLGGLLGGLISGLPVQ